MTGDFRLVDPCGDHLFHGRVGLGLRHLIESCRAEDGYSAHVSGASERLVHWSAQRISRQRDSRLRDVSLAGF
ncbi:MAG: hypothetical protein E3J21_01780 [Anaerolineales bacterium]|nr:MAG: hypothetical protein E3J21_01780 [Anaerolineales bacterium]